MKAQVKITSEVGKGTLVVFECPIHFHRSTHAEAPRLDSLGDFPIKRLHILQPPDGRNAQASPGTSNVTETVKNTVAVWLGWEVSFSSSLLPASESALYAILASDLKDDERASWSATIFSLGTRSSCLLVLGSSFGAISTNIALGDSVEPVFVHHP